MNSIDKCCDFCQLFGKCDPKELLIDDPSFKPRVKKDVCKRKRISQSKRSFDFLLDDSQVFEDFVGDLCLLGFILKMVSLGGIEGSDEFSGDFLDEFSHFKSLEGIRRNQLCASCEGFSYIPRDKVAFGNDCLAVDENGHFSVGIRVMSKGLQVGFCEPWLFFGDANLFEGEWDFFLEQNKPSPLCEGTYAIGDKSDSLSHSPDLYL